MSQTRRDFLKASLGASALLSMGPAVPTFLNRSATAATPNGDGQTILVVLQLSGGNDGLNTVVPYADDEYVKNRPTLRLPPDELHKIDSLLGFHPRMPGFSRLFKEGHLSVLHGMGYPNPNGDHAASMRNWQTAKPHQADCQTGWLGRLADDVAQSGEANVPAAFVGNIRQPFTLNAQTAVVPSIRSLEQYMLKRMPGAGDFAQRGGLDRAAELPRGDDNPLLEFVQQSALAARADSRKIEALVESPRSPEAAGYPAFPLARTFNLLAQLIRADLGIRVYHTELGGDGFGGFDNHANQLGNHCALVEQLSESVAAFIDDLERDKLLDRVLLMTFSEFGRTVAENGRRGTGHGSAAPVFLAGGKLKGGLVGKHPNLTDLENGGQKFHTDFRRLYATALDRWLGYDSQVILGEKFEPLDVLDT